MRILELINEALELKAGYFKEERSSGHGTRDKLLSTMPGAKFGLGNRGSLRRVISNRKLRSTEHRGVTNLDSDRISINIISNEKIKSDKHRVNCV
ncbi:hypothetical protein LguiA_013004 [Lonicera macranthoides]